MLQPGKIIEINDRIFLIEKLNYDDDGELDTIRAKCLTPMDGDSSEYFSLEVYDEDLIVAYTIQ